MYIVRDTEEEDEEEIEEYELLDQQKIEYTEADMKKGWGDEETLGSFICTGCT